MEEGKDRRYGEPRGKPAHFTAHDWRDVEHHNLAQVRVEGLNSLSQVNLEGTRDGETSLLARTAYLLLCGGVGIRVRAETCSAWSCTSDGEMRRARKRSSWHRVETLRYAFASVRKALARR